MKAYGISIQWLQLYRNCTVDVTAKRYQIGTLGAGTRVIPKQITVYNIGL